MLIHLVPKLYEAAFAVDSEIVDVSIPECGLILIGGKDITARRPFPNKRYLVACRKVGQKAMVGLLVDVEGWLPTYTVITRWLVDGEMIIHFVEHEVLDQELDAVSDEMVLWYGQHGRDWQRRWPACYQEAPVARQPSMDVASALIGGTKRPEGVRDVVDDGQRVLMREEFFKLHTIERGRLLDDENRVDFRVPNIQDAFGAKPCCLPEMSIPLSNGVTANFQLVPMPGDASCSAYHELLRENLAFMPSVYLSFCREGRVVAAKVPWDTVITGRSVCRINNEVLLREDDLLELDAKGWEILGQLGMFPTELV